MIDGERGRACKNGRIKSPKAWLREREIEDIYFPHHLEFLELIAIKVLMLFEADIHQLKKLVKELHRNTNQINWMQLVFHLLGWILSDGRNIMTNINSYEEIKVSMIVVLIPNRASSCPKFLKQLQKQSHQAPSLLKGYQAFYFSEFIFLSWNKKDNVKDTKLLITLQ